MIGIKELQKSIEVFENPSKHICVEEDGSISFCSDMVRAFEIAIEQFENMLSKFEFVKKDNKNYRKIEFSLGCTVEDAVLKLLEYKENEELVCGNFNDHMLYSDTVTMDSAYIEIAGKTKEELDNDYKECRERIIREQEEHNAKIPKLTEEWIQKGHKILDEKYHEEWDKVVPIRLSDLYEGMELKACLDIIKPLNNGCSLEEAKEIIENQGHSGMSFSLVRSMVGCFCDRGKEFAEFVNKN